jgi:hypothetical protein
MADRFYIVMPSCRWGNIERLSRRWLTEMEPHPFEIRWWIMAQGPEPDPKGVNKTNEALRMIRDGWLMAASDDTLHEPALLRRLGEVIKDNPDKRAVVVSERRPCGCVLHASPDSMKRCRVDGQQIIWRSDFIYNQQFDYEHRGDQADGDLAERMWAHDSSAFLFLDEVLVNFNSLEH